MFKRFSALAAIVFATSLTLGCGQAEIKPSEDATPEVDQGDIEKQIQEGMKQGGYSPQGTQDAGK